MVQDSLGMGPIRLHLNVGKKDSSTLRMGRMVCPETWVSNYHYSLRNNPKERSSLLLRGGSLTSRIFETSLRLSAYNEVPDHPITGHEGQKGEYRYSSTLSLTSVLYGVGGQRHAPAALPPGKRPGTRCIGGWVNPRAENLNLQRDLIPGSSSP